MHPVLKDFILKEIRSCANFVCERIEIGMAADEAYEALIGEPHVLEAFRQAEQYLTVGTRTGVISVKHGPFIFKLALWLPPTDKYPVHCIPGFPLYIHHGSKLEQALDLSIEVASQWAELEYVVQQLFSSPNPPMELTAEQYAFLLPWIRDLVADCDWHREPASFLNHHNSTWNRSTVAEMQRDVKAIMECKLPKGFPRLTLRVSYTCKTGKQLFAQYQMLRATREDGRLPARQPLSVVRDEETLVSKQLKEELEGVIVAWRKEEYERDRERQIRRMERKFELTKVQVQNDLGVGNGSK